MKLNAKLWPFLLSISLLGIEQAHAASLEGSLQSLINSILNRLLPAASGLYLAFHIFRAYVQDNPEVSKRTIPVVFGCLGILGFSAVWSYLTSHVR